MVSPPGPAFAARTASRSEQSESQALGAGSSLRVTTNVVARAFAAAASASTTTRATPIRALIEPRSNLPLSAEGVKEPPTSPSHRRQQRAKLLAVRLALVLAHRVRRELGL